jgi:hypothetical protein
MQAVYLFYSPEKRDALPRMIGIIVIVIISGKFSVVKNDQGAAARRPAVFVSFFLIVSLYIPLP